MVSSDQRGMSGGGRRSLFPIVFFVTMMRRWERRIIPLEEGQPLQARAAGEQLPVPAHASLMTPRGTPIVRT